LNEKNIESLALRGYNPSCKTLTIKESNMKKLTFSIAALAAIGTFAVAGGDIAPVEPVVDTPVVIESTGNFYMGIAYGYIKAEEKLNSIKWLDDSFDDLMLQAGYNFNQYVALEARYWIGISDVSIAGGDVSLDSFGIYVKPQYPVTQELNLYGLLGYATSEFDGSTVNGDNLDGFSWGLGASYDVTDNIELFVDYTYLYDDTSVSALGTKYDDSIDAVNFGVTYNF
jgi:opacity protein-like surface antigen